MNRKCPKHTSPRGRFNSLAAGIFAVLAFATMLLPALLVAAPPQASLSGRQPIKPTIPDADRNQTDKVFLEYADRLYYDEKPGLDKEEQYQVLAGNVRLRKGGMFMYCDSARLYDATNSVDAFGNVRMEQGDTLFVYADELNYDGREELAVLYADPGKKVRLINRDVTLRTEIFNYDMASEMGYYTVGGELTDKQNSLRSLSGEYHLDTKKALFETDVHLVSRQNKDTLYINSRSLTYNTDTHVAELTSQSEIINADGTIYSSSGTYNTETGVADLYQRSLVVTNRGNTLTGDTLFYNREKQYGIATGNMILTDSARQSSIQGDYGFYDELRDSVFVTGRALAKEYSKGDTLYLHGDTITAYLDLIDSTHVTNIFHKVRFYRYDLQGLCDSISLTERDSLMFMFRSPVIWTGERQIFGNLIMVHFNDSTVDWARLPQKGVAAEHIAEDCYQQLSGDDMTAWFNDSTLRRLYVEGSVELIQFPMESDSTYNKFVHVETSTMDAYFLPKSIEGIHFWPETTSKVTPLYLARKGSYFLPKFKWYGDLRPGTPAEVFIVPDGMVQLIESAEPIKPVGDKGPGGLQKESGNARPNPGAPPPRRRHVLESESPDNTPDAEITTPTSEETIESTAPVSDASEIIKEETEEK